MSELEQLNHAALGKTVTEYLLIYGIKTSWEYPGYLSIEIGWYLGGIVIMAVGAIDGPWGFSVIGADGDILEGAHPCIVWDHIAKIPAARICPLFLAGAIAQQTERLSHLYPKS